MDRHWCYLMIEDGVDMPVLVKYWRGGDDEDPLAELGKAVLNYGEYSVNVHMTFACEVKDISSNTINDLYQYARNASRDEIYDLPVPAIIDILANSPHLSEFDRHWWIREFVRPCYMTSPAYNHREWAIRFIGQSLDTPVAAAV